MPPPQMHPATLSRHLKEGGTPRWSHLQQVVLLQDSMPRTTPRSTSRASSTGQFLLATPGQLQTCGSSVQSCVPSCMHEGPRLQIGRQTGRDRQQRRNCVRLLDE